MVRSIYVTAVEPGVGKSAVVLGLMELLARRVGRVGFFRPVIGSGDGPDDDIELVRGRYRLAQSYEASYAATAEELARAGTREQYDALLTRVLESYRRVDRDAELVVVEGSDFTEGAQSLEFEFNADAATHLGSPVVLVVGGRDRTADQVLAAAHTAHAALVERGCTILATVCNRVDPDVAEDVRARLPRELDQPAYVLPEVRLLAAPTVAQVAEALGARLLPGGEGSDGALEREIGNVVVGAAGLPHFLDHVAEGDLIITYGDRADLIVGSLAARSSGSHPNVAGIVLTGGQVDEPVLRLIAGFSAAGVPILSVDTDTFKAAQTVSNVRGAITADSDRKIATALGLFDEHVDTAALEERIALTRSTRVTPLMFEQQLLERAAASRRHLVLPEGDDDRILTAADQLLRRGVVDLTVLGDPGQIRDRAASLGLELEGVRLVDPRNSAWREDFAATYHELRKHKGVAPDLARDLMDDVSYFGTMMVHKGLADGMVSGARHTTAHTIRPAFEFIRTVPGVSIVSSVFLMLLADRVLVYGDCAVVPNPDAEQLADIAISSAGTARQFGIEPLVAMLSYSTGESGSGAEVDKVRQATRIARDRRPDLPVEGPIQYDAAIDPTVARAKLPGSDVAGRATVFVFPDLNTGNNTYKAVQRSAGAVAIGPVLQGLRKPVNDLSRGALVPDIVNTVAITAIQAQGDEAAS